MSTEITNPENTKPVVYKRISDVEPSVIKKALILANGIISLAAKSIGFSRETLKKHIEKNDDLKDIQRQASEEVNDIAEGILFDKMIEERDWKATAFYLDRNHPKYKSKHGSDGKKGNVNILIQNFNNEDMSTDAQEAILNDILGKTLPNKTESED